MGIRSEVPEPEDLRILQQDAAGASADLVWTMLKLKVRAHDGAAVEVERTADCSSLRTWSVSAFEISNLERPLAESSRS